MKLTFLGTSHGVPSESRYCSSVLLERNGRQYLLDAGAPVIDLLLRQHIPLTDLKAVFLTHMHGDHCAGLFSLVDLSNWYFTDMNYTVFLPEASGEELLRQYLRVTAHSELRAGISLAPVHPGLCYEEAGLRISAIPVDHAVGFSCFAYCIEADGKTVLLTGDMRADLGDFPVLSSPPDLLVTEMAHCSAEDLHDRILACAPKKVVLTHVFPLSKIQQMEKIWQLPFLPIIAEDGLCLIV